MRQLVALMMLLMVMSLAAMAAGEQMEEIYATAGSEDIYFQPDSIEEQYDEDEEDEEDLEDQQEQQQQQQQPELGDNLEAIGETETSCEYSCPRYYRPICVKINDKLNTFATPCEYHNRLRCAHVAKRQHPGQDMPTFQLMYNNACIV
ncbi:hypothetical protein ACLKA7_005954 [Drosophila subpalustris]